MLGWKVIERQHQIRTYALSNGRITVLYVHHYADHATSYQYPDKLQVVTGPGQFQFKWIDPATGQTVREGSVQSNQIYAMLDVPPVTIDLACRLDRTP